jgi:hypothetical protein
VADPELELDPELAGVTRALDDPHAAIATAMLTMRARSRIRREG